jgi:hypothetical protein
MTDFSKDEYEAIERIFISPSNSLFNKGIWEGWLVARDYYTNPVYCITCGEREQALREALEEIKTGVCSEYPLTLGEIESIVMDTLIAISPQSNHQSTFVDKTDAG